MPHRRANQLALQENLRQLSIDLERLLGRAIENADALGYVLLLFDPDDPGPSLFMANAKPEVVEQSLRETAEEIVKKGATPMDLDPTMH
jgi:hypothetical protein